MKLLFIAADPREYAGFAGEPAPDLPVLWSRSATVGGHRALLVANGAGAKHAARGAGMAARQFEPDAIVSTGFCGALDPAFEIADIVAATVIQNGTRSYSVQAVAGRGVHHCAKVITIDYVARTSVEKRRLRESGASAVEMEAAGVAGVAEVLGLPFYCVRAVTDVAGEDIANDFNAALRNDGHFDTIKILTGAIRHPTVRVPELLRLRSRAVRAARRLGEFFADCRF